MLCATVGESSPPAAGCWQQSSRVGRRAAGNVEEHGYEAVRSEPFARRFDDFFSSYSGKNVIWVCDRGAVASPWRAGRPIEVKGMRI